ncbi:sigma-54-dependent transcriptional regulator, partial [Caldithrix abyssi]
MAKEKPSVLVVDDEANILKTMTICLEDIGLNVTSCQRPQEALQRIVKQSFDLAFVDLKMRPIDGLKVLKEIKTFSPETTVVIITAHGSIESAVEAMKEGAFHYLQKPFDYLELQILAQKALEYHRLRKEVENYRAQLRQLTGTENIITRHKKMLENIQMAKRIAATDLSVLIEGESGTGKELFAQLIYQHSDRQDKPFIKINCAALPDNLLESELFGHVKGAFTGAIKDRKGRFELADGGTIFLDEIGELSPSLQAKLLRVLQQKEFERLGESKSRKIDVRIIAATNKNL